MMYTIGVNNFVVFLFLFFILKKNVNIDYLKTILNFLLVLDHYGSQPFTVSNCLEHNSTRKCLCLCDVTLHRKQIAVRLLRNMHDGLGVRAWGVRQSRRPRMGCSTRRTLSRCRHVVVLLQQVMTQ